MSVQIIGIVVGIPALYVLGASRTPNLLATALVIHGLDGGVICGQAVDHEVRGDRPRRAFQGCGTFEHHRNRRGASCATDGIPDRPADPRNRPVCRHPEHTCQGNRLATSAQRDDFLVP